MLLPDKKMSEIISNHFLYGSAKDDNTHIDFIIDDFEYHLPIEKIYNFWNDYLSLEHNLVIKEVPSDYTTVIIDFCTFLETNNNILGEICGKIVQEIKDILKCITFDFRCYVFKNIKNPKKIRFHFPHFFMKTSVITSILIKSLHKKFMNKSDSNMVEEIVIPYFVELFDEKNGYLLHGTVNNSKFKQVKNLNFNIVNKGIKSGMIYTTYVLLSDKFSNESLYPIIFSINNQKPIAKSKYPLKKKTKHSLEVCKKINMNQLNEAHIENTQVLRECLSKSMSDKTYVPTSNLLNLVNTVEEVNCVNQQIQKLSSCDDFINLSSAKFSRPIFLNYSPVVNITNYWDGNKILDTQSKEKQSVLKRVYEHTKKFISSESFNQCTPEEIMSVYKELIVGNKFITENEERVCEERVYEERVCEERVCEERVCEEKVCEERVCEEKVLEERVCEERVCEERVFEEKVLEERDCENEETICDNKETICDNEETICENEERVCYNEGKIFCDDERVFDNEETIFCDDGRVFDNEETIFYNEERVCNNVETICENDAIIFGNEQKYYQNIDFKMYDVEKNVKIKKSVKKEKLLLWLTNHIRKAPKSSIKKSDFYHFYSECKCSECFSDNTVKISKQSFMGNVGKIFEDNDKFSFIKYEKKSETKNRIRFIVGFVYEEKHKERV